MNRILLCFALLLLMGCAESKKESPTVILAGEIINPTSDYVILYRGDVIVDSARLDNSNRFLIRLDSVHEGLHHFYHKPELQYVYLEKGDSMQMRLNTLNFDESLIFSGRGDALNNFMLEIFLANEQEEEYVASIYGLTPIEFKQKIDSLRNTKEESLQDIADESGISEQAYELARASIEYSSYIPMEAYPFYHKKRSGDDKIPELPENFYDYRRQVNFENEGFIYLRPYYNFMKYHLGNLAYMNCRRECDTENEKFRNQLHYNQHKMVLVDSLVKQPELRDNLFRSVAVDYLLKHDSEQNIKVFMDGFHRLSGNNKHRSEIDSLYVGIKRMQPDKELPDLMVYNVDGEPVSLKQISSDKQVVFYFWSGMEPGHLKIISKHIAGLKVKHPDYQFVGINLRTEQPRWKMLLETNQLDKEEQYWTDNFEKVAHTLIVYDPNKSIIAKDGVIVNAFANVYSSF